MLIEQHVADLDDTEHHQNENGKHDREFHQPLSSRVAKCLEEFHSNLPSFFIADSTLSVSWPFGEKRAEEWVSAATRCRRR